MVLGTSLHKLNPEKVHLFVAKFSCERYGSNHFGKKLIFLKLLAATSSERGYLNVVEFQD
jgi:hypothetical protein